MRRQPHGVSLCGPDQLAFEFKAFEVFRKILGPIAFVLHGDGIFSRRAGQMGLDHIGVVGIEDGGFIRPSEEIFRVFHEILIQGVRFGDKDDQGRPSRTADPAPPLPGRDDGPGVSHEEADIEIADVDSHFQCTGGYHA